MKITNEAKAVLQGYFADGDNDCLKASIQQSCCGTSLVFSLAKATDEDQTTQINGISVLMDEAAKERSETVTLDVEGGELSLKDEAPSGGCC